MSAINLDHWATLAAAAGGGTFRGDWESTGVVIAAPAEGGMNYLLEACHNATDTPALAFVEAVNPNNVLALIGELRVDPDAERMRYFGTAMMDSVCSPDKPAPQTLSLMQIMDLHKPRTLDELRTCIDAAKILTP